MNDKVKKAIDQKRGPNDPDFCIMCGEDVPEYKMSTDVKWRMNYSDCIGQLCAGCAVKHNKGDRG